VSLPHPSTDEAKIKALREALLRCDRYCEHLNHLRGEFHKAGEPCPVEKLIEAALYEQP
jgi:hypothetical protein